MNTHPNVETVVLLVNGIHGSGLEMIRFPVIDTVIGTQYVLPWPDNVGLFVNCYQRMNGVHGMVVVRSRNDPRRKRINATLL